MNEVRTTGTKRESIRRFQLALLLQQSLVTRCGAEDTGEEGTVGKGREEEQERRLTWQPVPGL